MAREQGWNTDPVLVAAIAQVAVQATDSGEWPAAVDQAAEVLGNAVDALCVVALRAGEGGDRLIPVGLHHPNPGVAIELDALMGTSFQASAFLGKAFLDGELMFARRISSSTLRVAGSAFADIADRWGLTSIMALPLEGRTGRLGAIGLARLGGAEEFAGEHFEFLGAAARVLALLVEDALLVDALRVIAGTDEVQLLWDSGQAKSIRLAGEDVELLSEREREVLALIALGHTNREVADRLVLSVRTIEWHRARIQWKLGVSSRADLVKAAHSMGVGKRVDPPDSAGSH